MILSVIVMSFHKRTMTAPPANLILHFKATVHGQPLHLGENYLTPFGEKFTLDMFRFYAGKATASYRGKPATDLFSVLDYRLIDFADSPSTSISLHLPAGDYDEILFQLGVDSADQAHGTQTGALDPMKGMFWTWNSGYTSFKIGGTSPESGQPSHAIAYHIGGYRSPDGTAAEIRSALPDHQSFQIPRTGTIQLNLLVELDNFFTGPFPVHIRSIPACTTPGTLAHQLFENFKGVFKGVEKPVRP
jgi:hypothetical protein